MLDSRGDYLGESGVFRPDLSRMCLNFDALGTADGGWDGRDDKKSEGYAVERIRNGLRVQPVQTRARTGVREVSQSGSEDWGRDARRER